MPFRRYRDSSLKAPASSPRLEVSACAPLARERVLSPAALPYQRPSSRVYANTYSQPELSRHNTTTITRHHATGCLLTPRPHAADTHAF